MRETDYDKALKWFLEGARQGHPYPSKKSFIKTFNKVYGHLFDSEGKSIPEQVKEPIAFWVNEPAKGWWNS